MAELNVFSPCVSVSRSNEMWVGENIGSNTAAPATEGSHDNERRLQEALQQANAICDPRDGAARLDAETRRSEAAALLSLVDGISVASDSRKARALRSFVRGKVLDDGESYVQEAEKELSRAVKLDPSLGGAWNQLGTCMWKKGDVQLAHDCWQNTLVHCSDGEHAKEATRKLSMAFRSSKGNNPDESLRLAKELISKDMSDTQSWTNLGNAYMSYFFASSLDREDLFRALKAYHRSDLDGQSQDPDVHFNKGTVYRYLEDYQNAVLELQRADELDKDLDASSQVLQMLKLVHEMHSMIARRCNIKPQRLAAVLATLPTMQAPITVAGCDYVDCHVGNLAEACNAGKMITVLITAIPYTERPIHLVVADREGTFFAMSIYNMQEGKLKPGDFVTALSPYLRICTVPQSLFEGVGLVTRSPSPLAGVEGETKSVAGPDGDQQNGPEATRDAGIAGGVEGGGGGGEVVSYRYCTPSQSAQALPFHPHSGHAPGASFSCRLMAALVVLLQVRPDLDGAGPAQRQALRHVVLRAAKGCVYRCGGTCTLDMHDRMRVGAGAVEVGVGLPLTRGAAWTWSEPVNPSTRGASAPAHVPPDGFRIASAGGEGTAMQRSAS